MYDAVLDADALMLVTEWKEFRLPSWAVVKKTMSQQVVMDGRNIYDKRNGRTGFYLPLYRQIIPYTTASSQT